MASDLPNGFVTFFLSMLASAIVAFGMVTNADFFAQSEVYTIIGGLMTGVLFFFLFLSVCSASQVIFPSRSSGYIEIILTLFPTLQVAGMLHRVCVTSGFLVSIGIIVYMQYVSDITYKHTDVTSTRTQSTTPSRKDKGKKHR